jgi:hypothetical protein
LLKRIERADYDVFSRRASVPLGQKLAILAVGLTRMTWARLVDLSAKELERFDRKFAEDRHRHWRRRGGHERGLRAGRGWAARATGRAARLPGRAREFLSASRRGEVIDNCQHVLFGCCTNLSGSTSASALPTKIHWTSEMTMIEPGGTAVEARAVRDCPRRCMAAEAQRPAHAFSLADKIALASRLRCVDASGPAKDSTASRWAIGSGGMGKQTGRNERFWRLVIASALNADIDSIALPYAAKVIRELFMNSAFAGSMGMSTVPLSELYAGVTPFLDQRGGSVRFEYAC